MAKVKIGLALAFLAVIAVALCFFRSKDDLEPLKETAEVSEDSEALYALVRQIAAAAEDKNAAKKLAPFMLVRDVTELERITEPLTTAPGLGELRFLGCTRHARSSARENTAVHVYSVPRKQSYAFYFRKDAKGSYKLGEIGLSTKKP